MNTSKYALSIFGYVLVETIISTCIGIENCQNPIFHSYGFCPLDMNGQKYFISICLYWWKKEKYNIPEECDYKNDEAVAEDDTDESEAENDNTKKKMKMTDIQR